LQTLVTISFGKEVKEVVRGDVSMTNGKKDQIWLRVGDGEAWLADWKLVWDGKKSYLVME
jgi:uncharacterized cupin superfamily protein